MSAELPPPSVHIIQEALLIANAAHVNQFRKGTGLPYILHPLSVSTRLRDACQETGTDQSSEMICAALLHDTIEDGPSPALIRDRIRDKCGTVVLGLVEELTNNAEQRSQYPSKTEYMIDKWLHMSANALCIKAADRLDNVMDSAQLPPSSQRELCTSTMEIFRHVLDKYPRPFPEVARVLIDKTVNMIASRIPVLFPENT